jgi:hypothetical protein
MSHVVQINELLSAAAHDESLLQSQGEQDATVTNCYAALAHASAYTFLSAAWAIQAQSNPAQVTIDDFMWHSHEPCTILQRVQHHAASASTLRLQRGRHVLRVSVTAPHVPHSISVWSNTAFQLVKNPVMLTDHEGWHISEVGGSITEASEGMWRVLCRHTFAVPKPCNVQVHLFAAPASTARSLTLLLVNNDTLHAQLLSLNQCTSRPMVPNLKGYTLVTIQDASLQKLPSGNYMLQVASDAAALELSPVPSARCDKFCGKYTPNRLGTVCRFVISPLTTCSVTVCIDLRPACLAGILVLEEAPGGLFGSTKGGKPGKGKKQDGPTTLAAEPPKIVYSARLAAHEIVPVIQVPPGRHILSFKLDRHHSLFDLDSKGRMVDASALGEAQTCAGNPIDGVQL